MSAHDHVHEMTGSRLRLAFGLTLVILLVEAGAGWLSHSLALLSDAGHILTDVIRIVTPAKAITRPSLSFKATV